jgi:hypothetical protein
MVSGRPVGVNSHTMSENKLLEAKGGIAVAFPADVSGATPCCGIGSGKVALPGSLEQAKGAVGPSMDLGTLTPARQ